MSQILVVGSANVDLVVTSDALPRPGQTLLGGSFSSHLGGKGLNQAVAAARAGAGVAMVARIGRDAHGQRLLEGLRGEGVDTLGVESVDRPTGVALIITAKGDNVIVVASGANAALSAEAIPERPFAAAKVVLAQLETPLDGVARAAELCARNGGSFILDPAPAGPIPEGLLGQVDWLTPNEGEAGSLLGLSGPVDGVEAARLLRAKGARGVVVKLGRRGVVLSWRDADPVALPAFAVDAVDTTAAGDVFNGAFAAALAEGRDPVGAARFAVAAAALSVTRLGAVSSIPHRAEVDAFLTARG